MQLSPRAIRPALLCGCVLLMLALRLPGVFGSFSYNQAALKTISACGGKGVDMIGGHLGAGGGYAPARGSWLKLMEARCMGDDQAAQAAMREALAASDARLDAV